MNLDSAVFYSNDVNKVIPFYQDILGLKMEYRQGDNYVSSLFENNVRLGIKKATDEREHPGAQTFFVSVDDVGAWNSKLKDAKVEFYKELTHESWGGDAFSVLDVDGNKIEFLRRNS